MSSLYECSRLITTNFEQHRINASFATYLSRGLFKSCLILPRINGPIVHACSQLATCCVCFYSRSGLQVSMYVAIINTTHQLSIHICRISLGLRRVKQKHDAIGCYGEQDEIIKRPEMKCKGKRKPEANTHLDKDEKERKYKRNKLGKGKRKTVIN